jgi:glycosyltransferase involved in cell wall biosynthesis
VPRRILLLITDLQIGGTPTVVRELSTRLNAPPDVIVDVACLSSRGPVADQLEESRVRVFPLDAHHSTDFGAIIRLARLVKTNQYDTVLSFLIHSNVAAACIAPFFPHVDFLQSIQTTQPYPRWHWLAQSIAHHAARKIVVPSPSVARAAREWADIPPEKIVTIANAIDLRPSRDTGFQPVPAAPVVKPRAAESHQHGLKTRVTGRPVPIGFIGRLDPIKRIGDLIEAVALLKERVEPHIFGEGSEQARIIQQIAQLGLQKSVTLHGAVASPQEALSQIELLVLPSDAEGFGLVLIEAMAAQVPVVATNVPGICDVITNERTGLLVPPRNPRALAAAIAKLLDDPPLRTRLVAAGLDDVQRRFTWDVALPQYRSLLSLSPA